MSLDFRDNGRAIAAMTLSTAGFILNDSLVKLSADDLPFGQILIVRGGFSIILMLAAFIATGGHRHIRSLLHPAVAIRTLAETMATLFYLTALFHMPIGNSTAILQAMPLLVTAGAAIFFKAPVGWRRWTAIGIGFIGVLLIVKPGLAGFNIWSLSALAGVICMAVRDLATQRMPREVSTFGVALASIAAVTILGIGFNVSEGWHPMEPKVYVYLAGAATLIVVGYVSLIMSMRIGEISVVAPFRYAAVLWALLLGYLIWGDLPDLLTVIGILIIISTGIYTFFREQRLSRMPVTRS